jgi:competence protein ComEC
MSAPERLDLSLGLGALFGGLALVHPLGLLGGVLGVYLRFPFLVGFALVLLRGLLLPLPEPPSGPLEVEGVVRQGLLRAPEGVFHVKPPLEDGVYRLRGRVRPPAPPRLPGGLDERAWLLGRGVRAVLEVERVLERTPVPDGREAFRARLREGLSPRVARVMEALTLGDKRGLGDYAAFQEAGLAHLLALSGLHVALLAAFLVLLLFPLGPPRYLLALLGLLLYLLLAGPTPSLVRATLMAGLSLLGLFLGLGRAGLLSALGVAFLLQVLLAPWSLHSLSLQLSYLAVLGIALLLPALPPAPGLLGLVQGAFWTTLAAQALTLPLLLHHFHLLPLLFPLANLLALPLVALLVPLGFLKLLLGGLLALPVEGVARLLLALTHLLAQGPRLVWGEVSPAGFALYYLGLLPLLLALRRQLAWDRALLLASLPAALSLLSAWPKPVEAYRLGQDAFLFRQGQREVLFLGQREDPEEVARALRALGVGGLEVLLAEEGRERPLRRALPVGEVVRPGREEAALRVGGMELEVTREGWTLSFAGYTARGTPQGGPVEVAGRGGSWTLPLGLEGAASLRLLLGYDW